MVTTQVGRVACVMMLATSAWAQSLPCSTHGSLSDCEGQLCENDMQYCVWNVAGGSCGCPSSCTEYSGLNPELCVNSACPSLLPQQHVPCKYDYDTKKCWCPQAAPTPVPLPQGCDKHSTQDTCEGDICANGVQYCVWNVAGGSCGCPDTCTEYSGLNPELCVNSACPSLLPQQHVPCKYDYDTKKCWCPEAAETGAPATPAPPTSAPPTSAPATRAPASTLVPATEAPELPLCNETTLVVNPSFEIITTSTNIAAALENGQVPGWTVSHGTPTVMGGAPGQGMRSAWMWSHNGAGEGIVTNVPFVDGQMYQVTMWVTTGNSPNGQFFVTAVNGLVPQTATWPLPSFTDREVMYSSGMVFSDWDEISFNYTATDAYTQLWIYPLWAGGAPQAQVRVDNIRVCEVGTDAPATPAPPTSAPPTSAPPTSAPSTPAPATPAPPTSAPLTSAPPTPAPATLVPTTEAPELPCNETTLVFNPSFEIMMTTTNIATALEDQQVPGWAVSHGTPTVVGGAPGQGLRSAWMWSHSGESEGIVTAVPFVEGVPYHVTMWVTTGNSWAGQFFVTAARGLVPQIATWPLPPFAKSELIYSNGMIFPIWDEITFNYTPTDNYTQLWIYPLLPGGPPGGVQAQVQVDNIRVCAQEIDVPATPAPPTPAPRTPAPETPLPPIPAPPVERCEDLNFQHKACVNTLCPGFAWQSRRMYCKYNEKTGVCWCPEEVETKAPATPWPVISDDCSSFHGLPRTCMSSLCFASGMKASCKYDYSSNLCLCA